MDLTPEQLRQWAEWAEARIADKYDTATWQVMVARLAVSPRHQRFTFAVWASQPFDGHGPQSTIETTTPGTEAGR